METRCHWRRHPTWTHSCVPVHRHGETRTSPSPPPPPPPPECGARHPIDRRHSQPRSTAPAWNATMTTDETTKATAMVAHRRAPPPPPPPPFLLLLRASSVVSFAGGTSSREAHPSGTLPSFRESHAWTSRRLSQFVNSDALATRAFVSGSRFRPREPPLPRQNRSMASRSYVFPLPARKTGSRIMTFVIGQHSASGSSSSSAAAAAAAAAAAEKPTAKPKPAASDDGDAIAADYWENHARKKGEVPQGPSSPLPPQPPPLKRRPAE
mmetsp:Transcript_3719/g.12776  ORF Transcript_3719/g.12776 Transcript_3719/m.12776 type:complete len:267 (+) Transcript_3719:755-1555(+)